MDQPAPVVTNTSSTSVSLQWVAPTRPNGIITNYVLHRRAPSLSPSPALHDVGISLDGTGFAVFPPEASILGGFSNEIRLSFRTLHSSGILLYFINQARTDILAIEFRDGIPWFIFDAGSGPGTVRPEGDATFDDGQWHELVAHQEGRRGTLTIDGVHTGTGDSAGSSQVISSNQNLYIGGIPNGAPRATLSGSAQVNATLSGLSFAGCIHRLLLNQEELNISAQSSPSAAVGRPSQGCPVDLERGVSFVGGGFMYFPDILSSSVFSLSFEVRTMQNSGLILFAYGSEGNATSALGLSVEESFLTTVVSAEDVQMVSVINSIPLCDGQWHSIAISQNGDELSVTVDFITDVLTLPSTGVTFSAGVYLGGVELDTTAYSLAVEIGLSVETPLSGCLRYSSTSLTVDSAVTPLVSAEASFVRFDGCGSSVTGECGAPWVELDAGQALETTDRGLTAFSGESFSVHAPWRLVEG